LSEELGARFREEASMKKLNVGSNFALLLLFFELALLKALQTRNWLRALF
jgi:hypothetical protein